MHSPLTEREWEILDFFCQGKDTRQIAETLVLSEETIHSHSKNVLRKLKVHSRQEAVELAERLGVLPSDPWLWAVVVVGDGRRGTRPRFPGASVVMRLEPAVVPAWASARAPAPASAWGPDWAWAGV